MFRWQREPGGASGRRPRSAREVGRGNAGLLIFLGAVVAGFFGSLAVYFLLRGDRGAPGGSPPSRRDGDAAGPRPAFVDVAEEAGIRFRHEAGSTGRYYYPEVMGAGCAFLDVDGDEDLDVYLVNGNRLPPDAPDPGITNALFVNDGAGAFTDATVEAGVGDPSYGQGCSAADPDGDGDQDLYVTNYGPNVLYRNRGDGRFDRVDGVLADPGWGQACAFFDADRDGDLDLYVQNYLIYSLEHHQDWPVTVGGRTVLDYCSPQGYEGQQDRLFENLGDGGFRDVTETSGIVAREGTGMGLVCADLDNDGDPDIVVSNDSRPNFYFRNDGRGRFTQCGLEVGLAYNVEGSTEAFMGVDAGDYDGDGLLDLVIPSLRAQGFNLYRNQGEVFRDVSVSAGLDVATSASTGFAPVFIDYDNDGDLDLFFSTGEVRMGRTSDWEGGSLADRYSMKSLLLENRGGRFVNVSDRAGPFFESRHISRACSAGDYDDDGDVDLLVTEMGGAAKLLRNDTRGGGWVGFRLVGKAPNRDAIGARLWLRVGGRSRMREIHAGGSYLGQHDRRVLFGLGAEGSYEDLRVRWPDGEQALYPPREIGRYHTIRQGEG